MKTTTGQRTVRTDAVLWAVIVVAPVVGFLLVRMLLIEVFAAWSRWQFSFRPEVENWALPYVGTDLPATLWAAGCAAAILIAALTLIAARAPSSSWSR